MAMLPTGIVISTTGTVAPTEKIGGVALGLTSTTVTTTKSPITKILTIRDTAMDGAAVRSSVMVELSGTGHTYSTTKALTSGVFAYKQIPSQFLARGMATMINGSANNSLRIVGNEQNRVRRNIATKSVGAQTNTAFRSGYFRHTGISGQRTNWSTAPSTNKVTYQNGVGGSIDDQAIYVTYKSIPGEFVYMDGSLTPKQDNYKSSTL
jgi:hypothetical protein